MKGKDKKSGPGGCQKQLTVIVCPKEILENDVHYIIYILL